MMNNSPVPWREVFTDEAAHTITGNVKIYESFPIPQLQTERRVWIYLPKSYNGILEKQIRVDVIPGGTHHEST
ncbi:MULTISPECIES: hypothetical protein [Paenibacillus]|uniref:hypothetical protein n=1 Tax=Paenibacillus TaxID=44249 RepID=UPI000404D0DD|nr:MULTISPECIES: hypothetical protein [Paenibacillus]